MPGKQDSNPEGRDIWLMATFGDGTETEPAGARRYAHVGIARLAAIEWSKAVPSVDLMIGGSVHARYRDGVEVDA